MNRNYQHIAEVSVLLLLHVVLVPFSGWGVPCGYKRRAAALKTHRVGTEKPQTREVFAVSAWPSDGPGNDSRLDILFLSCHMTLAVRPS